MTYLSQTIGRVLSKWERTCDAVRNGVGTLNAPLNLADSTGINKAQRQRLIAKLTTKMPIAWARHITRRMLFAGNDSTEDNHTNQHADLSVIQQRTHQDLMFALMRLTRRQNHAMCEVLESVAYEILVGTFRLT